MPEDRPEFLTLLKKLLEKLEQGEEKEVGTATVTTSAAKTNTEHGRLTANDK